MSAVAPVLDREKHAYTLEGKPLISVSRVLDTVIKKSFEGVDPEVLRNAAARGTLVERYATEWLATGGVVVPADERQDVIDRLEGFARFVDAFNPKLVVAQQLVWDSEQGIAGMLDFILEIQGVEWLVDMKVTASPEKAWALQLGAYLALSRHAGPAAILHINPKYANGYMWREYDSAACVKQWGAALAWYRVLEQLKTTE